MRNFITTNEKMSPARATKAMMRVVQPNPRGPMSRWNMIGKMTEPMDCQPRRHLVDSEDTHQCYLQMQ